VRPDETERRLRERLDALGPAPRGELLHVLMLPDLERAERIGELWGYPQSRTFAELWGGVGQGGLSHPLEQADGSEVSLRPSIAKLGPWSKQAE